MTHLEEQTDSPGGAYSADPAWAAPDIHPFERVLASWPTAAGLVLGAGAAPPSSGEGSVEVVLSAGAIRLGAALVGGEDVLVELAARVALCRAGGVEGLAGGDGDERSIRAIPHVLDDGGVLVEFGDQSDVERARRMLERDSRTLERMVEALPVSVFVKDAADGYRMVRVNRCFEETFGIHREDIVGTFDQDHFSPELCVKYRRDDESAFDDERLRVVEERIETMLGPRLARTIKVPIFDGAERPELLVGILQDVTDERSAERDSNAARAFRASLVDGLGAGARSDLGALLDELDRVAAAAPVAGAHQNASIDCARSITRRLLQRLDDVIDLGQVVAGRRNLGTFEVDAASLAEDVLRAHARAAGAKSIRLTVSDSRPLDGDRPREPLADPSRLRQALGHLVANALEYSPRGGSVEIGIVEAHNGRGIVFTVRDEGIGMSEGALLALRGGLKAPRPGTIVDRPKGLGLAITLQLVELMGGVLAVESELGVGTTCFVELRASGRGKGAAVEHLARASSVAPPRPALRVLVVDDNFPTQRILRRRLEALGHAATMASDAVEAAKFLRESPSGFDRVLVDLRLPGIDGVDLIASIRNQERERRARPAIIIALSGAAAGSEDAALDRARALAAGANSILLKPIRKDELIEEIDQGVGGVQRPDRLDPR